MKKLPAILISIFTTITILIIIFGYKVYYSHIQDADSIVKSELKTIADLKTNQIINWVEERKANAEIVMSNPFLNDGIQDWIKKHDDKNYRLIYNHFSKLRDSYHYIDILIINIPGEILFSLNGEEGAIHDELSDSLSNAFFHKKPVMTDLHNGPGNLPAHIDLIIPLINRTSQHATSAIILRCDANQFLYPLIQSWPLPSRTAETLLGRREENEIVFINPLRHVKNAAFNLRFPINNNKLPMAIVAQGHELLMEGYDYRGVEVLAATRIVRGTPWFMVSKVDKSEAYENVNRESFLIIGMFTGFVIITLIFFFYLWQYSQKKYLKELLDTKFALLSSEEKYKITLTSIGDAVITTDREGKITFVNPVAEKLTGWDNKAAIGQSLENIFKIFHEDTREILDNPVQKVISTGTTIGLSNHTILVSKSGQEYPIADSGAPIRNENGEIFGLVLVFRDQTKERLSNRTLAESELKYRVLFKNMMEGFALHELILDKQGQPCDYKFIEVNNAFEKVTGLLKKDIIGKNISDVLPGIKSDPADWIGRYGQVVLTGKERYFEDYAQSLDKWYAVHAFKTQELQFATTFEDITERKVAEKQLLESERRYKRMVANLPGMAFRCLNKEDWPMLYCSEGTKDLTGYNPEKFIQNKEITYGQIIHPNDWQMVWDSIQQALKSKNNYAIEYRIITKSSQIKWVWEKGQKIENHESEEILIEGLITDITQLKAAELKLKEREARWRTLLDTIPDSIWLKDKDGVYVACNKECEKFFGAKEKDIIGKTDYNFIDKKTADYFRKNDQLALKNKKPTINEEEVTYAIDGHKAILETIKTPVYNENNTLMGILGIARDITGRKEAEQEIGKLSTAIEQSPLSVLITNSKCEIEYVNPQFCKVTGYEQEEIEGLNPRLLKTGQPLESYYKEAWAVIKSGDIWQCEYKNYKKNGEIFWEDITISPIISTKGKITNFITLKQDITKTKELENQLLQSQKLEAIGQLAGGIAHDFNNLLTVINGYCSVLINDMERSNRFYSHIEQIAKAGERASTLTNQLLTFSRKQIIQPRNVNINFIIEDIEKILKRIIGENIVIKMQLANDLDNAHIDPGQINQIILNLVVNARDAMPKGGTLIIETKNFDVDNKFSAKHLNLNPGAYVVLSISDTGIGMDKKTKEHIFEPFFTTKEIGKGTGLGLSTVYGIVKQNGGNIWIYSEPEQGTTFRIYFPKANEDNANKQDLIYDRAIPAGSEKILIIEDDEDVLELLNAVLQSAGYDITSLVGIDLTKKDISRLKKKFDLLITDVIMPGLNGKEISEYMQKQNPELKVIFISGYTDNIISRSGIVQKGIIFLQKPFSSGTLLKTVGDVLQKQIKK